MIGYIELISKRIQANSSDFKSIWNQKFNQIICPIQMQTDIGTGTEFDDHQILFYFILCKLIILVKISHHLCVSTDETNNKNSNNKTSQISDDTRTASLTFWSSFAHFERIFVYHFPIQVDANRIHFISRNSQPLNMRIGAKPRKLYANHWIYYVLPNFFDMLGFSGTWICSFWRWLDKQLKIPVSGTVSEFRIQSKKYFA